VFTVGILALPVAIVLAHFMKCKLVSLISLGNILGNFILLSKFPKCFSREQRWNRNSGEQIWNRYRMDKEWIENGHGNPCGVAIC